MRSAADRLKPAADALARHPNETEVSLPLGARRGKSPCHRATCSLILTADSGGRAVAALSPVAEDLPEIARHRA